jgi:hypothetical protein
MKYSLLLISLISLALVSPNEARAELQCWDPIPNSTVNVQNAAQCGSVSSGAMLYDTATQKWTDPRTGEVVLNPYGTARPVFSQSDCGPNETYYPSTASELGIPNGTCQNNNARSVTESISLQQAVEAERQRQQQLQQQQAYQQSTAVGPANTLFCGGANGECTYTPLEPLPVPEGAQSGRDFGTFVSGIFRLLITFGGLFAVVMITVAGIGYMISESAVDIDKAKSRAKAALWGLVLLLGSWLILNTINPNILRFDLLRTSTTSLQNSNPGPQSVVPAGQNTNPSVADPAARTACENRTGAYVQTSTGLWVCQGLF